MQRWIDYIFITNRHLLFEYSILLTIFKVITGKPMSEIKTTFVVEILPNVERLFHKRETELLAYFEGIRKDI